MLVERLVGLPEAFEVERDHMMRARQRRHHVTPGEERSTKSVQEDQRRTIAPLLGVERGDGAPRHFERDSIAGIRRSSARVHAEARKQARENRRTPTPSHVVD